MTRTLPEIDMDISVALRGAADLFAERAKAQMPVDPPPPPLPVVDLSAYRNWFNPDTPSQVITVRSSQPVPLEVQASLRITVFAPEGAQISANLESPLVIKAGELFGTATITVKQFPPAGESATFDIELTGAQNAVIGVQSKVAFTVDGPPVVVPPDQLHVSLEISPAAPRSLPFEIPESNGRMALSVNLSHALDTDLVVQLQASGTARFGDDYTCPESITVPAGQQTASVIVETFDDGVYEKNEDLIIAIVPSDAYVIDQGSVQITIVDDDPEPPPPPPPPDPNPPAYTVRAAHPRMYLLDEQIPEAQARLKAAPKVLTALITQADAESTASNGPFDRTLSCAILWRLGLGKDAGIKSKYTVAEYQARAIDNLIRLCDKPINLAGNHFDLNHLEPVAWGYDWLWNELTDDQRSTVRARIVEALQDSWQSTVANDRLYMGYNTHSGLGMLLALAIHGETEIDWVARYWNENWWQEPPGARGGLWNRQFEKMLNGSGNNEDWLYMNNHAGIFAAKHAWETATGDTKSLDFPWFTEWALIHLHQGQADPVPNSTQVRWRMLPTSCAGGGYTTHGQAHVFSSETGAGGWRAPLGAWLRSQAQYSGRPASEEFLFRCVLGDPRVQPQSPQELNLPLEYQSGRTGFVYSRTSWDRNAPCMRFACSEFAYRATGVGDFSIWAGGLPLICHRSNLYDHGYAGLGRLTLPQILDTTTGKLISALSGDGTRVRDPIASMTHTDDGWHTADLSKLWGKVVSKMTRAVRAVWDSPTSGTVTVVDECVCKDGYKPVMTWGTPLEPVQQVGGTALSFFNGIAHAVMEFDRDPEIKILGGEGTEAGRDLDGTIYNEKGLATWLKLSRDQQIAAGGFYTVYVTPAAVAGVYRLVTTIKVGP